MQGPGNGKSVEEKKHTHFSQEEGEKTLLELERPEVDKNISLSRLGQHLRAHVQKCRRPEGLTCSRAPPEQIDTPHACVVVPHV